MSKWPKVQLGNISKLITKGTTPTTLGFGFYDKGVNFVKIESITDNGEFITDKLMKISDECHERLKRSQLEENDILFSIAGALGRTVIVDKKILPANTNQALAIIRLKDGIDSKYIQVMLKSDMIFEQFQKQMQGVAQLNLSLQNINDLVIYLPPIEEQKKIAKILDKASNLISLRKKQIEKLDLLVKAKFIDMFGDPVSNPMGLEEEYLGQLGELGRGVSKNRPRNAPELLDGEYPLIQTGDVSNAGLYIKDYYSTYSELGLKQSKMWNKGTLCITIAANIAKTGILDFNACFPDSVVGFVANQKTTNIFIHYWFGFFQRILEEQAPESAQKNINLKILNELKVIVPPIELQNQFIDFVQQVDKQKLILQQGLAKLELNYKALMQQYFG